MSISNLQDPASIGANESYLLRVGYAAFSRAKKLYYIQAALCIK